VGGITPLARLSSDSSSAARLTDSSLNRNESDDSVSLSSNVIVSVQDHRNGAEHSVSVECSLFICWLDKGSSVVSPSLASMQGLF
jgi:hypothetical protein